MIQKSRGIVFNIQRYSIHDGPGIRTTVFLKGCPLRCFWCQNPESQKRKPEIFLDRSKCSLCGRCVSACPRGASSIGEESSAIDRSQCAGCGKCVEVCPNGARQLVGKLMTTGEIMTEILKDRKFYENSQGGVTLSGGDPVAQPGFALDLLKSCKTAGLSTVLDTCGYAPEATLGKLLQYTDLVLFDIKTIDPKRHREGTGKSNRLILNNARMVAALKPMKVRVPLIPGFNDSLEHIGKLATFVRGELGPVSIELLPYNALAETKYKRLCVPYVALEDLGEEYKEEREAIVAKVMQERTGSALPHA